MSTERAFVLVDDEKTILDSLKAQLRGIFGRSYVYETAENVPEAWEVIEELHEEGADIVVVVSDWLMPGMKGDQFLIELSDRHPKVVRIMLTGQADQEAIQRVLDVAAAHRVFSKPWDIDKIAEVIREVLP